MNILITGGVGFIGANCSLYFAKKKHTITLVDNFSRPGVDKNALFIKKHFPKVKIIQSSIGQLSNYKQELKNADVVIHLAAQTAVTASISNPLLDFKSNLEASFQLLEFMRKNNSQATLIYASTNKVYGDLKKYRQYPKNGIQETEPLDFISPYGCSKGATDLYFQDYARIYGLNTVVMRQSCIYGPFQIGVEDQGWVAHFSKQFLSKKPISIFGDGKQIRDLLYVNDLIAAYELAIKKIKQVRGQAFNIGGGNKNTYSLLQVIALLEKKNGYRVPINFFKERIGDQRYFVSSNKKINRQLDWQVKTDFKIGLDKLIAWQKQFFQL